MAYYKISADTLTAIANAIRGKIGTSAKILVSELATKIDSISAQKPEQAKSVTITANGTQVVSPDSGKVLSGVTVNVNVPSVPSGSEGNVRFLVVDGVPDNPTDDSPSALYCQGKYYILGGQ